VKQIDHGRPKSGVGGGRKGSKSGNQGRGEVKQKRKAGGKVTGESQK